ncbi:autophagy-related protein 16-2-like isoform X2 [Hippoglossus hippoglossus]|uniref:autophagy-related protein 16-2-like isoform X2 n=1 Tax=Hippoglossus hippoglossus TaxID=8267 RepID=UPI00148E3041|nr:autophagy-related protein 16-2-like isoform X2 [Hippoglossus hippoglossus]
MAADGVASSRRTRTDSAGESERSCGFVVPGGDGGSGDTWRRHIVRQLKNRDRNQSDSFQDLIHFYSRLLDKSSLTNGILSRRPCTDSSSVSSLLNQNDQLKNTTGELAFQVLELQQQIKIKLLVLDEQDSSLLAERRRLAGAFDVRQELQGRAVQVQEENGALKMEYDVLLERQRGAETRLREEKVREGHLLEDMIHLKRQAAARMNSRNERRSRAREANLQKELQSAARSKVAIDSSSSAPTSRSTSPKNEHQDKSAERRHTRLFRSASATSPRILTSIRQLFEKRRGHSVCSLEEDQMSPVGICLSARVPARALQVLEAHEQGINTVRFSSSSDLLATGGTDRVIKLWDVRAGSLTHRATLDGSTEGITCVDFDSAGSRILAASYDKSALLWRLDDSVPKLTLTGHSRKVTAARFSPSLHQVVTGSADRTIRLWDLHRAACVQVVDVASYCSDLVCSENVIISGHYDCKIRVWDTRAVSCVQELPAQGKVTSLDLSSDHRQLLSCCRDDCLQLVDLRRWSNDRTCFRAEGFKCGSDSTKAVISPDGCFLAAGSADGTVYIWNVSNGNLETRLPDKHSSSISAVSWSLSGEYVVSVDKSRRAVLWSDI